MVEEVSFGQSWLFDATRYNFYLIGTNMVNSNDMLITLTGAQLCCTQWTYTTVEDV